ncbi:MAG: outer membrane lipoprotein chaperone LolA [Vicinamibacterales bacterium]
MPISANPLGVYTEPSLPAMRLSRFLPVLAVGLVLRAATSAAQIPSRALPSAQITAPAAEVAAALQRKYDTIKDFSASFTQTYEGGVLRRKAVESGTVYIKKPGKMRWEYTRPQKKLFVSNGQTIYMYFPDDKQVMTNPVPEQDQATSAVMFLMGKGDVTRDFTVRYADGGSPDTYVLRLDPRSRQAEYDWLEIVADRNTLQIRSLTAGDAQGGRSTFAFTNFKENPGLADKMFQFTIPRGTEVTSGKTP